MNNIALILPYFGKLPEWMNLYLESCRRNSFIDFIIFTDDSTAWNYPNNVIVHYCSLDDCVKKIQKKLDVHFHYEFRPYKLCDFKPAYGVIFEDYLKDYEFWGFCDCDVIWGDMSKFITKKVLRKYDKIGIHGHLEIFRNTYINNRLFFLGTEKIPYDSIISNPTIAWYDEYNGIDTIYKELNIPQYTCRFKVSDIFPQKTNGVFVDVFPFLNFQYQIWKFEDGHLYVCKLNRNKKIIRKREIMYMHFQKCKLKVNSIDDYNRFFISNNGFDNDIKSVLIDDLDSKNFCEHNVKNILKAKLKQKIFSLIRDFKCFANKSLETKIF